MPISVYYSDKFVQNLEEVFVWIYETNISQSEKFAEIKVKQLETEIDLAISSPSPFRRWEKIYNKKCSLISCL